MTQDSELRWLSVRTTLHCIVADRCSRSSVVVAFFFYIKNVHGWLLLLVNKDGRTLPALR